MSRHGKLIFQPTFVQRRKSKKYGLLQKMHFAAGQFCFAQIVRADYALGCMLSNEALLSQSEVDFDVDRGRSIAGHKAPALNRIFGGGGEHVVAADCLGGGYLAVG